MSTVLLTPEPKTVTSAPRRDAIPSWLREPLLHFVLLGGVLFGVDHVLATRKDDPRMIVVDGDVDREAIAVFKEARGHEPDAQELYALRRVWLDNEVLYREGLALELDKGDKTIRERVIFKALSVIDASLRQPPVDDGVLRDWFERHRVKYDEPARYDFQEAVLAGDRSESASRSFAAALNAGTPGDAQAGLRVFHARPHENLLQSYGPEFAAALEAAPPGEWRVLSSRDGFRVIRLDSTTPAKPAVFESLRGVVLQDWSDQVMSEQRSAAVAALAKKYTVKVTGAKQ